jgi:hypothetical protein
MKNTSHTRKINMAAMLMRIHWHSKKISESSFDQYLASVFYRKAKAKSFTIHDSRFTIHLSPTYDIDEACLTSIKDG